MSDSAARSWARVRATMGIWSSPSRSTVRFAPFMAVDEAPATSRLLTPEMFARSGSVFRCTAKLGGPQLSPTRPAVGVDPRAANLECVPCRKCGLGSRSGGAGIVRPMSSDAVRGLVFVSYSHVNPAWRDRLLVLLKPFVRQGRLQVWADPYIQAGAIWRREIDAALVRAHVGVVLLTPDLLASDFVTDVELPLLLRAASAGALTLLIVPIEAHAAGSTRFPAGGSGGFPVAVGSRRTLGRASAGSSEPGARDSDRGYRARGRSARRGCRRTRSAQTDRAGPVRTGSTPGCAARSPAVASQLPDARRGAQRAEAGAAWDVCRGGCVGNYRQCRPPWAGRSRQDRRCPRCGG